MKFKVTEVENVSTVFLDGEIDMDVADNVREVVFPLIDSGKEVHLNLKGVHKKTLLIFHHWIFLTS